MMAFAKKQTAVVYIDTNKAFFYLGSTGVILKLDFPPDVVSDLDLLSKEKLEQLIEIFIKTNNLEDGGFETILVFSQASVFEKDFTEEAVKEEDAKIQQFIDIVPFDEVLSKAYKLGKNTKVVAINKALYETIKNSLEKNKFYVYLVLPYSVLQEIATELKANVNLALIAGKIDSFKQYGLTGLENNNQTVKEKTGKPKEQNKRMYALVGVFIVLLVILVGLIISTLSQKPAAKKEAVSLPLPPTSTPIPTVIQENTEPATPAADLSTSQSAEIIPTQAP